MNDLTASALFAQQNADGGIMAGLMGCFAVVAAIFGVVFILSILIGWKIFTKAGRPGWESIVPFYSGWILITEICKLEPKWFILALIPFVNIVAGWVICMELAKKFGKSETFGIGLFFLGPIFSAILAFGDAEYQGGRKKKRSRDDVDEDDNW